MVRTFYRLQRQVELSLTGHGLTLPQFDVLATLGSDEGITQQELAGRLLVTKGNVCGVLDRLSMMGWVERRPDPDDGRANRIHLTAAGRKKLAEVMPEHHALVLKMTLPLSDADVKVLRSMLEALDRAIEPEP